MRRWAGLALGPVGALLFLQCSSQAPSGPGDIPLPDRVVGSAEAGLADAELPPLATDAAVPDPPPPEPCNKSAPFGAPQRLAGIPDDFHAATPRLSLDELTIYFTTRAVPPDGGAAHAELARATRPSRSSPFDAPAIMGAQSSAASDNDPTVGADHLTLWFHSGRSGNAELYFASRPSAESAWSAPALVPDVNTTSAEAHAYYRASNAELWFISNRGGNYDIFMAPRTLTGFAPPTAVAELNSDVNDWQPMITEDGLQVLLASDRPGGKGNFDLYLAKRASTKAAFGAPVALAELNTEGVEFAGWLSADGCRIYYSSNIGTNLTYQQLYVAERPK